MLRPSRDRLSQVHRLKSPGHVHDISVAGVDSLGDAADTNKVYGVPCLQKILGDQRLSHGCSEGSNADEKNKEKERPADVKATDVTTRTTAPSSALCTFPGGQGERPAGEKKKVERCVCVCVWLLRMRGTSVVCVFGWRRVRLFYGLFELRFFISLLLSSAGALLLHRSATKS